MTWDGKERRRSNLEELQDIRITLATLSQKVEGWMSTTTEYRLSLCDKLKDVTDKLNVLPCRERKGWYQGMSRQVAFMWAVLAILIAAVLGSFAAGAHDRSALKEEVKEILCSKTPCVK